MTEEKFRRLLAIYGADISRWPEEYRGEALGLTGRADLMAALDAEEGLDRLLSAAAPAIDEARVGRQLDLLADRVAKEAALEEEEDAAWSPLAFIRSGAWLPQGAVYAGLFMAGCLGNLLARATISFSPLELWMFNSTSMPFGG